MAEERLEEVRQARLAKREEVLTTGGNPYPAEAQRTHTTQAFADQFADLTKDETPVVVVGRVLAVRRHGGIAFLDLADGHGQVQIQISQDSLPEEIFTRLDLIDVGDFLQVAGTAGLTKQDKQAVVAREFHLLTKSIRPLPSTHFGIKDHETRFRQREVDLLLNASSRQALELRSTVIQWLRDYLRAEGYLEVETPILQSVAGGAAARPFLTHHNTLDIPLYLRIAAELHLKRLLVAGYEKVFEIGHRFRNEGVDRQHNPEFTMLESQWAYADYEDLMDFTEVTLERLCREVTGGTDITWQGTTFDFSRPFARLRYVDALSERLGVDILEEKDPTVYIQLLKKEGLEVPPVTTYYQLVDELYKELIRPTLQQPTLVYDYPIEMAPLAKPQATDPRIAEKFQLLTAGMELNNCYTELNDPVAQRAALVRQQEDRDAGDEEAPEIDEEYLRAMEYGMPPNAGWSLGIDRFVMLLADMPNLRETIPFPLLKPE